MTKEQQAKLDSTLLSLQKKHGKESISVFGKNRSLVERVPVSSMNLTQIFGGGYPRGRMIEIYGPESSGKTTLATFLSAECQKHFFKDKDRNGVVAFIDVEHAFDPEYAKTFGLDVENILFSQPNSAEQALDIVEELVQSDVVDLIVLDSVAALTPEAEANAGMGDQQMGLQARLMSKACRKLNAVMKPTSASIIFLNQVREAIGVMYGNPEVVSGGKALKFYSSIRLTTRRKENVEDGGKIVGMLSHVKAIKNKVAPPFKECDMKIIFGKGYQTEEEYVTAFVNYNLIEKSGSWFTAYEDSSKQKSIFKLQGIEKVSDWFKENLEVFEQYKTKVQAIIAGTSVADEGIKEVSPEEEAKIIAEQEKLEKEELEKGSVKADEVTPTRK